MAGGVRSLVIRICWFSKHEFHPLNKDNVTPETHSLSAALPAALPSGQETGPLSPGTAAVAASFPPAGAQLLCSGSQPSPPPAAAFARHHGKSSLPTLVTSRQLFAPSAGTTRCGLGQRSGLRGVCSACRDLSLSTATPGPRLGGWDAVPEQMPTAPGCLPPWGNSRHPSGQMPL